MDNSVMFGFCVYDVYIKNRKGEKNYPRGEFIGEFSATSYKQSKELALKYLVDSGIYDDNELTIKDLTSNLL